METKNLFNAISTTVLIIVSAILAALLYLNYIDIRFFVGLIVLTILITSSIKIADQWEKAVLLRMGKYIGLKGPGIFFIVPILDKIMNYIDQKVRAMNLIGEGLKEKGSMIIVPSCALDAMNLGGIRGITSLSQLNKTERKL